MNKIYLDFESRSKVDIWQVGAYAYSVHPSTEVLCLAYAIDNEPVEIIKKDELGLIPPFDIKDNIFIAHSALFEQCIWQNIMVAKWGWPRIPIKQWRCSMSKALASAYPQSLANAGKALNTKHQKSTTGHTLMLKMSKPNAKGEWCNEQKDFEALYQYCIDDVAAERELDKCLPDLIPAEQTLWFLDQLINQRGIAIDIAAVKIALQFIDEYSRRLNNLVYSESGFVLDRVTRRQAVLDWCRTQGVDITSYTKSEVSKILQSDTLPEKVREILEAKLQLGKTSVAKYQALENATTSDGRLRDTLIYHGASTGRWTGKLFQLHNLPKSSIANTDKAIEFLKESTLEEFELFYPDVMGTLSSCIRGMIISAPGKELFVGDFSAIEARVVLWLAGEHFKEGIYEDMARRIYGVSKVSKEQRELGKRAILGCGFGMGAPKFQATCATWGAPISIELAEKAVKTYRETYLKVKQMWYEQENAAIEAIKKRSAILTCHTEWSFYQSKNLTCRLPSGRCLTYPEATLEYHTTPYGDRKLTLCYMAVDSKNRWSKERSYGGKLVENITQAVARDILAQAMLRLEKNGFPVIFSVHDEVVCEVLEHTQSLDKFCEILCKMPDWSAELPIKAECWRDSRYKKG